jgi:hypothetical protein
MISNENEEGEKELTVEEWLAIRKKEGLKIDPETAVVLWHWAYVLDPYGVLELPEEARCTGRSYFARSPESDVWVSFHDLPEATVYRLWQRIDSGELPGDLDWFGDA